MTVDHILERCRELASSSLATISDGWKAEHPGGRTIAVYPVFAPAEVIQAGGMLPLGLSGGGTSVELTHADARFQSFVPGRSSRRTPPRSRSRAWRRRRSGPIRSSGCTS